jgi:iron complex transport system permease protein
MKLANQILLLFLGIFFIFIFIFAMANLKYGVKDYAWHQIFEVLLHPAQDPLETIIILKVRLPMVLMAIMAGAGIAISGALLQCATQNPLACPSLSGIEYGTAFCVILTYMFLPQITPSGILIIALTGGGLTYLLIQAIAQKTSATAAGITLIGMAFNALYYSAIQATLLAFPYQAQSILYNLNGSLQGVTLQQVGLITLPFLLLMIGVVFYAKWLDFLSLDENQAKALGIPIKSYQFIIVGFAILFSTLMTSMIGPLLFFSLIVPHFVKLFTRNVMLILACAIFGAAFLLAAKLLIQWLAPQSPPPVGLIILLMSGPLMIYIIRRYFSYD